MIPLKLLQPPANLSFHLFPLPLNSVKILLNATVCLLHLLLSEDFFWRFRHNGYYLYVY